MSYTKNTWATGDTITATKLNNMESGIEAAGGYDIVVSVSDINSCYVSDYTVAWDYPSVLAKVRAGELVTGVLVQHYNYDVLVDGDTCLELFPLASMNIYSESGSMIFSFIRPDGDFSDITFSIYGGRIALGFNPETGAITSVDAQRGSRTVS